MIMDGLEAQECIVGGLSRVDVEGDGGKFDLTMTEKDLVVDLFRVSGRYEIAEESRIYPTC